VHGRSRQYGTDEEHLGVAREVLYARHDFPPEGSQWTGIVTAVATAMLREGKVDAVACVGSSQEDSRLPEPILATTESEVLATAGVKPTLSPTLKLLEEVERRGVRRLLYVGVGCAVQALRSVESELKVDEVYVLGTNCADNGTKEGFLKFLNACSTEPGTVIAYEFMQDYNVEFKHRSPDDGSLWFERVPYFSLPADELGDVIAPSCKSCFDYTNGLADLVVGYMGVPPQSNQPMTRHPQFLTVRNARGREMLDLVRPHLAEWAPETSGDRQPFVEQTITADERASSPEQSSGSLPVWAGKALAWLLSKLGPRGVEFAKYSIDYHYVRNALYTYRVMPSEQAERHIPPHAKRIVSKYNLDRFLQG